MTFGPGQKDVAGGLHAWDMRRMRGAQPSRRMQCNGTRDKVQGKGQTVLKVVVHLCQAGLFHAWFGAIVASLCCCFWPDYRVLQVLQEVTGPEGIVSHTSHGRQRRSLLMRLPLGTEQFLGG